MPPSFAGNRIDAMQVEMGYGKHRPPMKAQGELIGAQSSGNINVRIVDCHRLLCARFHVTHKLHISTDDVVAIANEPLWYHERVMDASWGNVPKNEDQIVFVQYFCGKLAT